MMTKLTNNPPPVGDAGRGVSPAAEDRARHTGQGGEASAPR